MGKYEKAGKPRKKSAAENTAARRSKKKTAKRWPLVVGIVAACVILIGCAAGYMLLRDDGKIAQNVYVAGIDIGGMRREEAKEALKDVTFDEPMNVSLYTRGDSFPLYTTTYDPSTEVAVDIYGKPLENAQQPVALPKDDTAEDNEDPSAPLDENGKPYRLDQTLTLPAQDVGMTLNVDAAVEEAYQYGRSVKVNKDAARTDVDVSRHLALNEDYIQEVLERYLEDTVCVGTETTIVKSTTTITDNDGNAKTVDCIEITLGTLKRDIAVNTLYDEIVAAYMRGDHALQYVYEETLPEACDLDALYQQYDCVAPVNAFCDEETYEITDGKNGYGFRMADALLAFSSAKPGDTVILTLTELEPTFTREKLQTQLFHDVLATYDSPHVYNPTRTKNLDLACQAIDGTILRPGEEFSFNKIVGQRTSEKGYGPAGVYVGGRTEQQLGGGVCQVASVIYYCTLKSDLEVIERYEHQYTPDYVPWGMDATIYWGSLDYRFRNNTAFPIRIDASVSGGYVHITFVGTETKEYTVKLDYEVTASFAGGEKIIEVSPDMPDYNKYKDYADGEVIQIRYNGANVTTYRYKYDKNDNLISTEIVNYSKYDSRDREVIKIVDEPTEPTDEPTEPPTEPEPTEPEPSETTSPPTEPPTVPPTEPPTDPPTDSPTDSPEP